MPGRWTLPQSKGLLAALIVSMIGAGFSAHAGYVSISHAVPPPPPPPPAMGFETQDHFPGAAYFYAIDDDVSPAPGVTGTADLPGAPPPDFMPGDDAGITAAAPFRMSGSAEDKGRALQCLTTAIYYEAATEPDDGQQAVAQVILNRVRHPAFPDTVCGVVYQGSERRGCQFSFACDGSLARKPEAAYWERARRVAQAALGGHVFAPVGLATHYHTYAVRPAWNKALVMTGVFGAHFFHRWKGYWGTAAAFHERYAGAEPVPGPHRPLDPPAAALTLADGAGAPPPALAAVAQPAPAPARTATPPANVQPAYRDSGTTTGAISDDSAQILPRWRDSGTPIR